MIESLRAIALRERAIPTAAKTGSIWFQRTDLWMGHHKGLQARREDQGRSTDFDDVNFALGDQDVKRAATEACEPAGCRNAHADGFGLNVVFDRRR